MDFCCPVCGLPLVTVDNLIKRCAGGHSFDRARAGYYNLLVGAGAGTHGDNREMVEARRAFLSAGHYAPLAERVAALAAESIGRGGTVLDVGAGEGYYTDAVCRALRAAGVEADVLAFDISRDAAKQLARRNSDIRAAVASAYSMPVGDSSCDLALLLFSPLAIEEISRVLKPRAKFIMVFPGEMHLFGLKRAIYDTPYKNKPEPTELRGFRLLSDEELRYEITLADPTDIRNLFMMTPYAYRTGKEGRERVLSLDRLATEVSFRILVYEKDEKSTDV